MKFALIAAACALALVGCSSGVKLAGAPPVSASTTASTTAPAPSSPPTTEQDTPTPTPTPTPTQAIVLKFGQGQSITQGDSGDAVVTINTIKVNANTGNPYEQPTNGQFVIADITVTATSGSVSYSTADFTLTTPDLRQWDAEFFSDFAPPLMSGTVVAPHAVRGNVAFDIEAGPISGINLVGGDDSEVIATWTS